MKTKVALAAAALLAAALLAFVLAGPPARAPQPARPRYRESPILEERVRRLELPPVEPRLPETPLVVPPVEGTGRYDSAPAPRGRP